MTRHKCFQGNIKTGVKYDSPLSAFILNNFFLVETLDLKLYVFSFHVKSNF